jgi:hypothetical protein
MQGWRRLGDGITFAPDDFEILDLTLYVMPELRVCAQAVKMARAAGIRYPIDNPDELLALVDEDAGFAGGGYEFSREGARAYLPPEYFPIAHEGELMSRIFLALTRARLEAALAAHAGQST